MSGNSVDSTELLQAPHSDHRLNDTIVAAWPTEEMLALCVSERRATALVVFEWGKAPALPGWATAVQASDAETGHTTAPLSPDLHDVFFDMLSHDDYLYEGTKAGRHRHTVQEHIRQLKSRRVSIRTSSSRISSRWVSAEALDGSANFARWPVYGRCTTNAV